jgi:CBS domain-containing protein
MMTQTVQEVMTPSPIALSAEATVQDAAQQMRDASIGDVLVKDNGDLCGIVTDRDIVLRVVAEGRDPGSTTLRDVCSHDLVTIEQDESADEAVRLMRERDIRRLAVVEGGQPVGIVTLGDLAAERDPNSALGDISSAPPNE